MKEQTYRPAWRSFYTPMLSMAGCFILVAWLSIRYTLPSLLFKGLWYFCLIFILSAIANICYKRLSSKLILKPHEITLEQGLFGRESVVINIKNIRTIQIKQTLMQRLLNVGDVLIASTGADKYEIFVAKMPSPQEIRDAVQIRERIADDPDQRDTYPTEG